MFRFSCYTLLLVVACRFIVNALPFDSRAVGQPRAEKFPQNTPQRRPLPEETATETDTDTRNRRSDHDATTVTTTRKPRDNKEPFTMAYYPSWITMDLATVDFTPYDWIDFAFAVPTEDFGLAWNEQQHEETVKQIVAKAHQGETKVKISIGGWSGSKYFSAAVSNDENRKKFAENLKNLCATTGADGIDLDWEFPGVRAAGNPFSKDDTANLLLFSKTLRETFGTNLVMTTAVDHNLWVDATGQPSKDLKGFGELFDWITFMAYNFNVPRKGEEPGANTPLSNACGNSSRPESNVEFEMQRYLDAGIPANKLAIGFPGYGYLYPSNNDKLRTREAAVTLQSEEGKNEGYIQFSALVKAGVLNDKSEGVGGFTRRWDNCSSTPFLTGNGQLVSYDDPESLRLKGNLVKDRGLWGMAMWDIHGDTQGGVLIKAAMEGMGRTMDNKPA